MQIVNAILRPVFDGLLLPFQGLHPFVGIAVVSLLTSVLMLVMFKRTSNQDKIVAVKAKITPGSSRSASSTTTSGRFSARRARSSGTTSRTSGCRSCRCSG